MGKIHYTHTHILKANPETKDSHSRDNCQKPLFLQQKAKRM